MVLAKPRNPQLYLFADYYLKRQGLFLCNKQKEFNVVEIWCMCCVQSKT